MKTCAKCGLEKEEAQFNGRPDSSREAHTRYRDCQRSAAEKPVLRHRVHVRDAQARNLAPLTLDEWAAITHGPCAYGDGRVNPALRMGVDRRDSSLNYPGNSVPSCAFHNYVKGPWLTYKQMRAAMDCEQTPCSNSRPKKSVRFLGRLKSFNLYRDTTPLAGRLPFLAGTHPGSCVESAESLDALKAKLDNMKGRPLSPRARRRASFAPRGRK